MGLESALKMPEVKICLRKIRRLTLSCFFIFWPGGDGVMCQPMCQPVCQVKVFTSDGKLVDEALKRERKLNGSLLRMGFVPRNKACLPKNTFSCPELQIHQKGDLVFFAFKKKCDCDLFVDLLSPPVLDHK